MVEGRVINLGSEGNRHKIKALVVVGEVHSRWGLGDMTNEEVLGTGVEAGVGDGGSRHNDRCMIVLCLGLGIFLHHLHACFSFLASG